MTRSAYTRYFYRSVLIVKVEQSNEVLNGYNEENSFHLQMERGFVCEEL